MYDLCLKNTKILQNNTLTECSIHIKNGKISKISKTPEKSDKTINLEEKISLPGFIDPHVHFRDPGLTYKEDFHTGTRAAARGGFTSIIDMPNTQPKTNTYKNFQDKIKIAEQKSIIDFALHAGINTNLNEIPKIKQLKPASYKIFMDLMTHEEIAKVFQKVSLQENPLITVHCEDKHIIETKTEQLKKEGQTEPITYSKARPSHSEDVAVMEAVSLALLYKVNLHICHISTYASLIYTNAMKPVFKAENLILTNEITPQHLFLDNTSFNKCGNISKTNPPLRPPGENITINNIKYIDMIGTDHAPHSLEEKNKDVWTSSPGIPNIEIVARLLLTEINNKNLTLSCFQNLTSTNAAKAFNLENKGTLNEGKDADITVIDLNKTGKIDVDSFESKAHYSPFEGREYIGDVHMTISRGNIVLENETIYDNTGKYLY